MHDEKQSNDALFQQVIEQRDTYARLATDPTANPFSISGAEVRSIIAYTNTDSRQPWTDEKVIYIPEGWAYFNHFWHETTGLGDRRVYDPWVVRDSENSSRIIEVRIKVQAFARLFARSWVGAQLSVTLVPLTALTGHARFLSTALE